VSVADLGFLEWGFRFRGITAIAHIATSYQAEVVEELPIENDVLSVIKLA